MLVRLFTLFCLLLLISFTSVQVVFPCDFAPLREKPPAHELFSRKGAKAPSYAQEARAPVPKPTATPQTFTAEGISIEFTVEPARPSQAEPMAGEEATVRFKISGT